MPEPLRGVNLGGWLVLEPWMTPSLFAGTDAKDEYTFMTTPDAAAKLRRHHETFITEDDFAWLGEQGLDLVRLPVGTGCCTRTRPTWPPPTFSTRRWTQPNRYG